MPGLNQVNRPKLSTIETWLRCGNYSWQSATANTYSLNVAVPQTVDLGLTGAIASEISRFSCAAYESLLDAANPSADVRALGWPIVRHYYATFYCAHALLRIAGISVTYVSSEVTTILNHLGGQYLGVSPQMSSGLYQLVRHAVTPNVVVLSKVGSGAGGSHVDMWKLFLAFLVDTENSILQTHGQIPDAIKTVDVSTKLRAILCLQNKASGSWPSTVRNAVNYRHDYGIWYPYTRKAQSCLDLSARMKRWHPDDPKGFDIGASREHLADFADACNVVTQLLTASLRDIARRSPKSGKSFVDHQPFKLLRQRNFNV